MSKMLIIKASTTPLKEYHCNKCDSVVTASVDSKPFCPFCNAAITEAGKNVKPTITAAASNSSSKIICNSCKSTQIYANTDLTTDEIIMGKYCVVCGSEDLVDAEDESDTTEDNMDAVPDDDSEGNMEEVETDVQDALEGGCNTKMKSGCSTKVKSETNCDPQDPNCETEDPLEPDNLQWVSTDDKTGENSVMQACSLKTGNPVLRFSKGNTPKSLQPFFASATFVNTFNEIAKNSSVATAVKHLGGTYVSSPNLLASIDMEELALQKLTAHALPKLIDCMQLAVEGGVKGIYSELASPLKSVLIDEIITAGVPRDKANIVASNYLTINAGTMFSAIVAKAMELYSKDDSVFAENKSMVQAATGPSVAEYNHDEANVRQVLSSTMPITSNNFSVSNGTVNVTANTREATIDSLRKNLKLGRY